MVAERERTLQELNPQAPQARRLALQTDRPADPGSLGEAGLVQGDDPVGLLAGLESRRSEYLPPSSSEKSSKRASPSSTLGESNVSLSVVSQENVCQTRSLKFARPDQSRDRSAVTLPHMGELPAPEQPLPCRRLAEHRGVMDAQLLERGDGVGSWRVALLFWEVRGRALLTTPTPQPKPSLHRDSPSGPSSDARRRPDFQRLPAEGEPRQELERVVEPLEALDATPGSPGDKPSHTNRKQTGPKDPYFGERTRRPATMGVRAMVSRIRGIWDSFEKAQAPASSAQNPSPSGSMETSNPKRRPTKYAAITKAHKTR